MSEGKDLVRALIAAAGHGNKAALRDMLHADARWWAPPSSARHGLSRPLIGRDAVAALMSGESGFFKPGTTTWNVIKLIEEGPTVVGHLHRRCLTAAGIPYENEYLFRYDIVDGKIAEVWEQTDTALAHDLLSGQSAQTK